MAGIILSSLVPFLTAGIQKYFSPASKNLKLERNKDFSTGIMLLLYKE